MKNSEAKITAGIDLYFSNLSSRKVRNHFRRHLENNASHVVILDWCRKYTMKVYKYTEKLKPKLQGRYYADETYIDCEGRKDKFWVNVDWDSRLITNLHYSYDAEYGKEAIAFMRKTRQKNIPKFIQTDYANFYPKAFKEAFGDTKVEHRRNNVSVTGKHNVRIETVFMKIKDRVDD